MISFREPNQYVGFEGALSELSVLTGKDNLQHICSNGSTTSFHIDRLRFDRLLEESNNLEKARLRATACSKAASWLQVTPRISQTLDLTPPQLCVLCRLWLGLAIFPPNHKCGRCYSDTELLGFHALTCQYGGHRGLRHDDIRDVINEAAQSARWHVGLEVRGLLTDVKERPADILIYGDPPEVINFAATHLQQVAYVDIASASGGAAAAAYANNRKDPTDGAVNNSIAHNMPNLLEFFSYTIIEQGFENISVRKRREAYWMGQLMADCPLGLTQGMSLVWRDIT
ncbi:hypothetical protein GJ496_007087 [Pomphorhynchus laevis]|nr:hypothetical protein GJ496_007087 [Pomphorhynchus laevis]